MSVLLATYDLHEKPSEEYEDFYNIIERYPNVRLSESSYAIDTDDTPKTVSDKLISITGKDDRYFIITLAHGWHGKSKDKKVFDWLREHLV